MNIFLEEKSFEDRLCNDDLNFSNRHKLLLKSEIYAYHRKKYFPDNVEFDKEYNSSN
jgi:hypothetical protein